MAMRLVPGGTLATLVKRGPLDHARPFAVLRETAEARSLSAGGGAFHTICTFTSVVVASLDVPLDERPHALLDRSTQRSEPILGDDILGG